MVAEGYQPTFHELVGRLRRETGASHQDANRAVMEALGKGWLRTTFSSRIALGGGSDGGGQHYLGITAALLGIIGSLLTIWEVGARNGFIAGPGPLEIAFPSVFDIPTIDPFPSIPGIPTGEQLEAPAAALSGDCQVGYTISWTSIEGAEDYRIEEDGHFRATEDGTDFFIPPQELSDGHRYEVFATALLRPRSDASNAITIDAC